MSTVNRITSNYKLHTSFTEMSLPSSSGAFLEIASVAAFGILYKSILKFDNKGIIVTCEIDGIEIFEIDLRKLKDMSGHDNDKISSPLVFSDHEDIFVFNPTYPIMFRESVKFYAKSSSSSSSRDLESFVIEYTEE